MQTISLCNQTAGSTQPGHLSVGRCNDVGDGPQRVDKVGPETRTAGIYHTDPDG